MKFYLCLLFLINSLLIKVALTQQDSQQQRSNCLFIGCVCESNDAKSDSSNENDESSSESSEQTIRCASSVFPQRDYSKSARTVITEFDYTSKGLKEIPANRLVNLSIDVADFSRNIIERIDVDAFKGIQRLELLFLSRNKLANIDDETFLPLGLCLTELKLNHNELGKMDTNKLSLVLSPFKNISILTLNHNHLVKLPDLSKSTSLSELTLENNFISSLLDETTNLPLLPKSLITLNLKENRLTELNDNSFDNLENLKYLDLESNQINSINENTFKKLKSLSTLTLNKNYINHIPSRAFYLLDHLFRLELSSQNQMLRRIDNYAFDRRHNLNQFTKLDLSNNRISSLADKVFCSRNKQYPYVHVKEIDLASNSLTTLNACIVRQLAKGLSIYEEVNKHNKSSKVKISFKPSQQNQLMTDTLKCDCEITRSQSLADLIGTCKTNEGEVHNLKSYSCNIISSLITDDELNRICKSSVYDCEDVKSGDDEQQHGQSEEELVEKSNEPQRPVDGSGGNEQSDNSQSSSSSDLPAPSENNNDDKQQQQQAGVDDVSENPTAPHVVVDSPKHPVESNDNKLGPQTDDRSSGTGSSSSGSGSDNNNNNSLNPNPANNEPTSSGNVVAAANQDNQQPPNSNSNKERERINQATKQPNAVTSNANRLALFSFNSFTYCLFVLIATLVSSTSLNCFIVKTSSSSSSPSLKSSSSSTTSSSSSF